MISSFVVSTLGSTADELSFCFGESPESMLCFLCSASEDDDGALREVAGGILRSNIHSDECGCDGIEGFVARIYSFGRKFALLVFCESCFLPLERLENIDMVKG